MMALDSTMPPLIPETVFQNDNTDEVEDDVANLPKMTTQAILNAALEQGGYQTPQLNDNLYLHYKGYRKIENLEQYYNLKALWLDSNGFQMIENLSHLKHLRCLFLQRNLLCRIENLNGLENLVQLDLSENRISMVEGLSCLPQLKTLNLAKNHLSNADSIQHLVECRQISSLDFTRNNLQGGEDILQVLGSIDSLLTMNMIGNPIYGDMPHFRKRCILAMKHLRYLDRPIFDDERASVEAWSLGGTEAERKVKQDWQHRKSQEEKQGLEDFRAWQAKIRAKAIKDKELRLMDQRVVSNDHAIDTLQHDCEIIPIDDDSTTQGDSEVEFHSENDDKTNVETCAGTEHPFKESTIDSLSDQVEISVNEYNKKVNEETKTRHYDEDTSNDIKTMIFNREVKPNIWSKDMDKILTDLVKAHMYDFPQVANDLQNNFPSFQQYITEDECRFRWCLLDSLEQSEASFDHDEINNESSFDLSEEENILIENIKPLKSFLSESSNGRLTYEEISSKPKRVLAYAPTEFPTMDTLHEE